MGGAVRAQGELLPCSGCPRACAAGKPTDVGMAHFGLAESVEHSSACTDSPAEAFYKHQVACQSTALEACCPAAAVQTRQGALLQGLEQSQAMMRLGLRLCFSPKHCSGHFQLDVSHPEHAEVARKLVDMAMKVGCLFPQPACPSTSHCGALTQPPTWCLQATDMHNWWNIRISGRLKLIPENNTMWAVLTTGSFTPVLELDFLSPADAHELLGLADADKLAAMPAGEASRASVHAEPDKPLGRCRPAPPVPPGESSAQK